jgi:hypothetical protein
MGKQLSVLVLFVMLSSLAMAERAGSEKSLGRLFYTPSQRSQLEQMEKKPGIRIPASSSISVNGVVQRQGQGGIVWINGIARHDDSADGLLEGSVTTPDSVLIRVPGGSQPVRLKVGQTMDVMSGTVSTGPPPALPAAPSGKVVADTKGKVVEEGVVRGDQGPE